MKRTTLIATLTLALASLGELRAEVDWETLPIAPRDDETSEWWASTWHPGDVVPMVSRYQFEGKLCVRKKDQKGLRWWELYKKYLEAELAVRVHGVARCTTSVLDAPQSKPNAAEQETASPTQLLRAFHSCPQSCRAVGVVGLKDGVIVEKSVRKALDHFYEELQSPEAQKAMDECIKFGKRIAGLAAEGLVWAGSVSAAAAETAATAGAAAPAAGAQLAATAAAGEAARRLTELAVQWVGRKAKEYVTNKSKQLRSENLEELAGGRFESYGDSDIRGAEMKADSWLYKKLDKSEADDVINFVTAINELFDNGRFYLAGVPGEAILAKRLVDSDGDDGEAMRVFSEGVTNLTTLAEKMGRVPLTPADYRVSNIFARETLNVNATIFDIRKRSIGDVWRVDGALLNNFLHPDLQGRFEGTIFLKYMSDERISLAGFPEAKDKVFQTRHLVMMPRHMGMQSRLSYRETGFRMDYDPDTQDAAVSVWVDKKSGHVVKVEVRGDGNVAALPKLALFRGFSLYDSTGRLHFEMSAEANPVRLLSDIKE